MVLRGLTLTLLAASASANLFVNSPPSAAAPPLPGQHPIPSIHESALQSRRILHLNNIATFSTVFPSASAAQSYPDAATFEQRPTDIGPDSAIGLMEYYALCGPSTADPTILGVTIATTMKNAAAGSNATLSLRYQPPADAPPPSDPWAYLPANLPRFALVGSVERLTDDEVRDSKVRECFLEAHPEARIWEPGSDVHDSWWGRLVVKEVYFFGGFGDRARIGEFYTRCLPPPELTRPPRLASDRCLAQHYAEGDTRVSSGGREGPPGLWNSADGAAVSPESLRAAALC